MPKFYPCKIMTLPPRKQLRAASDAIALNPANRPKVGMIPTLLSLLGGTDEIVSDVSPPAALTVLTDKYWGTQGRELGVSFMETTRQDLRDRIISHMNAWYDQAKANVRFRDSKSDGEVRISRGRGGYWSYLGPDILHIPKSQQTMNLEGFTMSTPESEYKRVVRHETGHTLGFPHEHMREELINLLDYQKTIDYFKQFQGWDEQTTVQQVLTPLSRASIMGTPADQTSIMCYQLPASITKNGKPIPGGDDINATDAAFAAKLYPMMVTPPPPPPVKPKVVVVAPEEKIVTMPKDWTAVHEE